MRRASGRSSSTSPSGSPREDILTSLWITITAGATNVSLDATKGYKEPPEQVQKTFYIFVERTRDDARALRDASALIMQISEMRCGPSMRSPMRGAIASSTSW